MAITTQPLALEERRQAARNIFGGSLAESIAAGATIVLSLIALSGTLVATLLPIAVLAMGAAFLLEGGSISLRFTRLLAEASEEDIEKADFGIGVTSEFLGGVTGIVLGILAILKLAPMILIPVAVLVFGATLILSSRMMVRLNSLELEGFTENNRVRKIAYEITAAAAGVEFLLGISAVILGIIALTGTATATLSLVAVLIVAISGFVTGAAASARMANIYKTRTV